MIKYRHVSDDNAWCKGLCLVTSTLLPTLLTACILQCLEFAYLRMAIVVSNPLSLQWRTSVPSCLCCSQLRLTLSLQQDREALPQTWQIPFWYAQPWQYVALGSRRVVLQDLHLLCDGRKVFLDRRLSSFIFLAEFVEPSLHGSGAGPPCIQRCLWVLTGGGRSRLRLFHHRYLRC